MITQQHPEISIAFRRVGSNEIALIVSARASKDKELTRRAQIIAESLKHLLPVLIQAAEKEIAEAAKNETTSEVMH